MTDDIGRDMAEKLMNGTLRSGSNRKWPFASMTIGQYAEVTEREEYNAAVNAARAVERRKGFSFTRHFDRYTGRGVIVRTACLLLMLWAGTAHAQSYDYSYTPEPLTGTYAPYPPTAQNDEEVRGYQPPPIETPQPNIYLTPAETLADCAYSHDCQGAFERKQ